MPKKRSKSNNSEKREFKVDSYNFDDGIDPRELLLQHTMPGGAQTKKLFHSSWAEKVVEEEVRPFYLEDEDEQEQGKKQTMTALDHDRNSNARSSSLIPIPKNLVSTDELGAPKAKKKKVNFRKLVKKPRSGGNSKKV